MNLLVPISAMSPSDLWFDMFPSGYDTEKFVRCTGERFERKCVAKLLDQEANKAVARKNYAHTMSSTVTELLENGSVTIENAQKIAAAKKFVTQQRAVDSPNPDLTEAGIEIIFAHYKSQQPTKKYPETKVQLIGHPNNTLQKKKHYYIYSNKSGFGKTFHMQKFTREYNAHFIGDLGNWLSVPEHTQFLIIDEISVGNKMEFSKLKQLTSGDVLGFGANMKTFGSSFTPRPDVQLIIIGNMSPFDVYGTWNSKLQRRMMCGDHIDQLEDRFTIVRLDGSVREDKLRTMTPTDWSPDQYDQEMRRVIGDVCPGEINTPFEAIKIVNK